MELPVFVESRHACPGNQFLVLSVVPRADEKHVIRVDDNAVLQPPDGHKLVLVGGQDDIAPVLLQDAAAGVGEVAVQFSECQITIKKDAKTADAKRIMGIMGLGVKAGQEIVVTAEGTKEEEAIVAIEKFLQENL